MMGGEARKRDAGQQEAEDDAREKVVEVDGLTAKHLHDVSIYLRKGEILGISGLAGSGQTDLLNIIFNAKKKNYHGKVRVSGSVSYVSGDRAKEGVFPLWSILDNVLVANLKQVRSGLLLDRKNPKSWRSAGTIS